MMGERIERLLGSAAALGADTVVLHATENIRYFCGFTGEGCALVASGRRTIFTDSRYTEQAEGQAAGFDIVDVGPRKTEELAAEIMREAGARAVAFEDERLTVSQFRALEATLGAIPLKGLGNACVRLRAVKDGVEIGHLKKAAEITDAVFRYALTIARPGITELDLCAELKYHMAKRYGAAPAFEFIVASGVNGSMPHAIPSEKKIEAGDMVTLDFGAEWEGYKADMTRTFAVGRPSDAMREVYEIVREAQGRAADALAPGADCRAVDAVARDFIRARGYGGSFGHGLGHGVGLQVHEEPRLSPRAEGALAPGMAVTVEPGIYLPGVGGVRIEDTCVVTSDGWESLFVSDKGLIIL